MWKQFPRIHMVEVAEDHDIKSHNLTTPLEVAAKSTQPSTRLKKNHSPP